MTGSTAGSPTSFFQVPTACTEVVPPKALCTALRMSPTVSGQRFKQALGTTTRNSLRRHIPASDCLVSARTYFGRTGCGALLAIGTVGGKPYFKLLYAATADGLVGKTGTKRFLKSPTKQSNGPVSTSKPLRKVADSFRFGASFRINGIMGRNGNQHIHGGYPELKNCASEKRHAPIGGK